MLSSYDLRKKGKAYIVFFRIISLNINSYFCTSYILRRIEKVALCLTLFTKRPWTNNKPAYDHRKPKNCIA